MRKRNVLKVEKRSTRGKNLWLGTALVAVLLVGSVAASAQERGQYLPGFRGLNSGIQTPPGFTYANYFFWYPADRLNDRDGDDVPLDFDLDLLADMNLFAYTTKGKFLGANYGFLVGVPIVNTSLGLSRLGSGITTVGLGDIYVEPINLGWTLPKWNVYVAYGFVAPTGRFDSGGTDTTTTDYWGHEVTVAATRSLDQKKLWQLSVSSVWEFHQNKRHEDVRVGNNVTVEYGVGRTWVHNQGQRLVQFGAAGYAEFQLTDDSGADVVPLNQGANDRVFALGPELGVIWPAKKFNFLVRVLPEFGARSRTSGFTIVAAIGKSF